MAAKIACHGCTVQSTAGGLHVSGNLRHSDIAVGSGIRFTSQPLQQLVRKQAHAIATGRRYLLIGTTGGDVLARGGLGNALNIVKGVGAEGTGQALHRKGATDSEVLFLLALAEGLDGDPAGAMARAVARLEELSRMHGTAPYMRVSAAFSDGERLFAVRYSSDRIAPSLYYRWSESRQGWAVVSEPLEQAQDGWSELPPGQALELGAEGIKQTAFLPKI